MNENEAAIEIIRFRVSDYKTNDFTDSILYAALILKSQGSPEFIQIGSEKALEEQYKLYIDEIISNTSPYSNTYKAIGISSFITFWQSLAEKLKETKKVFISCDGVYHKINLNTLINPQTKKFLINELDIHYLTSTRDICDSNDIITSIKNAVLIGNPKFEIDSTFQNDKNSERTKNDLSLGLISKEDLDDIVRDGLCDELPNTKIEIVEIDNILRNNNWNTQVYTQEYASEYNLKKIQGPAILHIATHGKFLRDTELSMLSYFDFDSSYLKDNPLIRSMLFFSGANNSIKDKLPAINSYDDGILYAIEAQNLNLENTELVVLSACETALGNIRNGEGVYGLQRAFMFAGSKSVMMSLWKVADKETQELMVDLYKFFIEGYKPTEALLEVQRLYQEEYPNPYYWGSFIIISN